MESFRYWLSFKLLVLGVRILPDEHTKYWVKYGLKVAGRGVEESLNDES